MRSLASIHKALSDETRLTMLGLLVTEGELCVCDFVAVLGITQSKASRHLRHLVNAGLLQDRREAVWVHFRLAETPAPLPARVLSHLRDELPLHVTPGLHEALAVWRERKRHDDTACCRKEGS